MNRFRRPIFALVLIPGIVSIAVVWFWIRSYIVGIDPGWIVFHGTMAGKPINFGEVPYALLFVLGLIPAVCYWRYFVRVERRQAREKAGLCSRCGYDLRNSRGERCPECGTLIWRKFDEAGSD